MAKSDHVLNYVTANRFYVEIGGSLSACFTECSGVAVNIKAEPLFEGGVNDQQRILIGQADFPDVTLKRGITNDLTFWKWIDKVLAGKRDRRNVNILVFNQAGETMQSWTLIGAVPKSWKAPSLSADSTTVAIEELVLAYEGLKVSKSGGGGASKSLARDKSGYFPSR